MGGSTISMQLAKNLFLSRDKTISRKINELFLSWYLNETFSKNEILEFYLNAIEFGPNLYGIGVASDFYFAKKPHELNLKEEYLSSKKSYLIRHTTLQITALDSILHSRKSSTLRCLQRWHWE